ASSKFTISSVAGASGASFLFDNALEAGKGTSGILASTPTNVQTTGTDRVENSLSTNTLLSSLTDKDNANLGLSVGNVISFTGSQNGRGFKASLVVDNSTTIGDLMSLMRSVDSFKGTNVGLDLSRGTIIIDGK